MVISNFKNFIGQDNIIERILILIKCSKIQNIALSHILLIGASGNGKTTIAQLIAEELQVNFHSLQGTSINKASDIISILANIKQYDIVLLMLTKALINRIPNILQLCDYNIQDIKAIIW